jgi:hypothetical protein
MKALTGCHHDLRLWDLMTATVVVIAAVSPAFCCESE